MHPKAPTYILKFPNLQPPFLTLHSLQKIAAHDIKIHLSVEKSTLPPIEKYFPNLGIHFPNFGIYFPLFGIHFPKFGK